MSSLLAITQSDVDVLPAERVKRRRPTVSEQPSGQQLFSVLQFVIWMIFQQTRIPKRVKPAEKAKRLTNLLLVWMTGVRPTAHQTEFCSLAEAVDLAADRLIPTAQQAAALMDALAAEFSELVRRRSTKDVKPAAALKLLLARLEQAAAQQNHKLADYLFAQMPSEEAITIAAELQPALSEDLRAPRPVACITRGLWRDHLCRDHDQPQITPRRDRC